MKLIIFDFDGTLVDSQRMIISAFRNAAKTVGLAIPERNSVLNTIGLSLKESIIKMFPDLPPVSLDKLTDEFQRAFLEIRSSSCKKSLSSPYLGVVPFLENLSKKPDYILAIASGKTSVGLQFDLDLHGLGKFFKNIQTCDFHPSKPDPTMLETCLKETGTKPCNAIMVGDTSYDIEMAKAVPMKSIGVTWGYHARHALKDARPDSLVNSFEELERIIYEMMS